VNKDSGTIQYYGLKQKLVKDFVLSDDNGTDASCLAIYQNDLYYADTKDSIIYKVNKNNGKSRSVVRSGINNVLSMRIFDEDMQDGTNACSKERPDGHRCAHLCLPASTQQHICRCAQGFRVDPSDSSICIGEDDILIYSTNEGFNGISVASGKTEVTATTGVMPPISQIGSASKLDFHAVQDLIVWADSDAGTISTIQRDGTNRRLIVEGAEIIQGIAVDWIADNLYWSNPHSDVIEMCRLNNGSDKFVIISQGLDKPGAMAVHPSAGYLFWADTGDVPRIERSGLDGSNRIIIANSSLQFPADLTVDLEEAYIYW
ncbi:unnamed protein product, partial [Meganyctiphanes norvegica]